jgi:tripartite-type tricarboxylate transporter receptor subunit TctC
MQMRKTNPADQISKAIMTSSMSRRAALFGAFAGTASLMLGSSTKAEARAWPSRSVRIVTAGPPGSAPDLAARIWSERLSALWKQPVVIENKPGGDGIIAVQAMLGARDGHTLFFGPHFIYSTLHNTNTDIALRPRDEMVPICSSSTDFIGVAVSPRRPVSSLAELKAYAQAHPGTLNWFAPSGSVLWLLFSDFVLKTDPQMLFVPYRGSPQAIMDLAEDRLHIAMMPIGPLITQRRRARSG